ncbi:MAG: hypothetical protein ACR2GO_06040 [Candidatus Limnocylindria bacterium]
MSAFGGEATMATGATWASANGLEWVPHGKAPMETIEDNGTECQEYPRTIESAGPWLVASADLSGPCSEGGFAVHGTQLISIDGATWRSLPFDVGTLGESRSGSSVSAALPGDELLILAGEKDGGAAFWIGEAP